MKLNILGIWNGAFKVAFITQMGRTFMAYSTTLRCSTSDIMKLQFAQHAYVLQYTNQVLECALNIINHGVIIAVVDT